MRRTESSEASERASNLNQRSLDVSSFTVEISGTQNLNKFNNVIQFFSKIGKYLILEVDDERIIMRTLNDAKSAFASVEFDKHDFFCHFNLQNSQSSGDIPVFTCKLLIRPLCVILRKAKKMRSLKIFNDINSDGEHQLTFVLTCENGIRRRHRFIYQSCDIISAMFDDDVCNRLRVMPKVLTQLFGHISKSLEVAVDVSMEHFKIKSFHQHNLSIESTLAAKQQKLHTMTSEMCVDPEEFDMYEFRYSNEPQELAFCCKELRAILWLCESLDIPDLTFFFTEGGSPVKFACEDSSITCQLVMATLEPRGSSGDQRSQRASSRREQHTSNTHDGHQNGSNRNGVNDVEVNDANLETGVYEDENERRKRLESRLDNDSEEDLNVTSQRKKSRVRRAVMVDDED